MSPRSTFTSIQINTMEQRPRLASQSLPTTNHNSPTHTSQVPLLNLAVAQKQYALVKSKSMPGTSRELPAPTKFTFSSHDVSTMSKMTDNTSQIPHWREFPKPPIRILCRVELKAKLKLDTYKSTSHLQEYHHKSSYPTKPISVFEPSPEQQYIQQYYEYDSHDESEEEWESSDDEEEDDEDAENYGYTYHAPIQPSHQQPSSKHFTFPMQHQQPQQPSHQQYIPRTQYDYQKSTAMRPQQQYQQPQPQSSQQQRMSIQNMEEKKRMIQLSSMKSVPIKQQPPPQQPNNQVVFTIHPQQHKYSQPDMKRASFSQPSQQQPQHQRSSSAHQMEIRRHRSAPSIPSQTPPKHIAYQQPQQPQQPQTNAYDVARNLWRKQRRSYQDMLSTLQTKLHVSAGSYPQQCVSP